MTDPDDKEQEQTYPEGEWGIYCPATCGLIFETQFDLDEHLERVPAHSGMDA